MLKILQDRLQQYVKWEIPDVQAGFRKGRRTRDHIVNVCWIICKAKEVQKRVYFCFTGGFPGGSDGKASVCNAGDPGLIPGLGRSTGEGNDSPLQYCAWKIQWTAEPGRLLSVGSQRVGHDWATSLSLSVSLTMLKSLIVWVTMNCGKFLKRWEYQTIISVFWTAYIWVKI